MARPPLPYRSPPSSALSLSGVCSLAVFSEPWFVGGASRTMCRAELQTARAFVMHFRVNSAKVSRQSSQIPRHRVALRLKGILRGPTLAPACPPWDPSLAPACSLPFQCWRFLEKRMASVLAASEATPLCSVQVIAWVAARPSLFWISETELLFAIYVTSSTKDTLATSHLSSTVS